ncbi:MAG TPA: PEP-utilizing enzyme [Acidimicrobiales bacterium]|jgi:phosphoenolpyruvate-protein kinase (PTS system EI component)
MRVTEQAPVRGRWHSLLTSADLPELPDAGVVAVVRDPGAVWLASVRSALVAVVCTTGTPRSHVGIMASNLGLPCVVGVTFGPDGPPADGTEVEVDCSGEDGVLRA